MARCAKNYFVTGLDESPLVLVGVGPLLARVAEIDVIWPTSESVNALVLSSTMTRQRSLR